MSKSLNNPSDITFLQQIDKTTLHHENDFKIIIYQLQIIGLVIKIVTEKDLLNMENH